MYNDNNNYNIYKNRKGRLDCTPNRMTPLYYVIHLKRGGVVI